MSFRVTVRTFNQYQSYCSPKVCSRRCFSGCSNDKSLKSSTTVDGKTIRYIRRGKGEHAVLCLPGALGSSLPDFKLQIEGLDQKTFTIIAWDPPGYGHSRPPSRDFSPGFLKRDAEYAVDFMKAINLPKFSVLGGSDGGITGIFLAANYPENLRKMAIWGSNAYITDEEAEIYRKIRDVSAWSKLAKAPMVELYGEDGFRTMWEQWIDEFLRIHREGGDICKAELKSIQCPLLVLHGEKDPLVLPEHPLYIVDNVSDSQLHTFKNGKHNIHTQCAGEFNSFVHKFLTSEENSYREELRVPVRLSAFCSENPAVWFAQIEEQLFQASKITDDLTKFNYVVLQLDAKYAAKVEDVVCNPPGDGKYKLLKTELIKRLKEDRLKQMFVHTEIGQKKPSEFLNYLIRLAGSRVPELFIRKLWLRGLPEHLQAHVKTQSGPLDSIAELADKAAEMQNVSIDWSSIEHTRNMIINELTALAEASANKLFDVASAYKLDLTGWPVLGTRTSLYKQEIRETSNYHSLLAQYPAILNPSDIPRPVHCHTRHRISTKSSSAVSMESFPLSEEESSIARDVIDSMVRLGTARPSNSPYGSALRIFNARTARHSSEHSYRGVFRALGDYRLLNRDTVSDPYRIRYPFELSDSLSDCNVFSVIQLHAGWTHIPVAPEDVAKTAVVTPFGKFEFPIMPRGLLNSKKTWQKFLDEVLQDLPCCFGFRSHILVFTRDHEEHLQQIRALFEKLSTSSIYVRAAGCVFGKPRVNFDAYSISGSGCSPIPEKVVKGIEDIPSPKTYADVERFLNMNREYRRYIPEALERPLRSLVEGPATNWNSPVPWTTELEKAFQDCNSALAQTTLNSQISPLAPLSISISVVGSAFGAVLNQKTGTHTVPLAFMSKRMKPSRDLFYAYLVATYISLKVFRKLSGVSEFTVHVDDESSVNILGNHRFLTPYDFYVASFCCRYTNQVQFIKPLDNGAARCLAASLDSETDSTNVSYKTDRLINSV